ncbi:F510_1955 family glycosylhydrolase [Nonomuraea sp. NPDC050790]|uniref:F510_1955 family glycosylhydrolase n=1 Tax=Nonomuraea sp. NPDC050790 TaxID=3364371 RepID=UPI003797EA6E
MRRTLVYLVLAVTACAPQEPTAARDPAAAPDPGIGHVHGVGVDPADGAVYLAAHYGLFRVTGERGAVRVAGRVQDHMGFTVTGPKTFLASGHPGAADQDSPPHLGLIRTTDAGATWTTVSEKGSADFHALQPAGADLYAFDSTTGRVRWSGDGGRTWTQGAADEVIDLAYSGGRLYATTRDGLKVSTNRGLDFEPVPKAPPLTHVDAGKALTGVDTDGRVHSSGDGGRSWRAAGSLPGPAVAFAAVGERRLLAVTEDGVVHDSGDGGLTFNVLFRPADT